MNLYEFEASLGLLSESQASQGYISETSKEETNKSEEKLRKTHMHVHTLNNEKVKKFPNFISFGDGSFMSTHHLCHHQPH